MNKYHQYTTLFWITSLMIFFLFPSLVLASPLPPEPVCQITAMVTEINVDYSPRDAKKEREMSWGKELSKWMNWFTRSNSDGTVIKILKVDSEPVVEGYFPKEGYCEQQYSIDQEIILNLAEDYSPGTIIEAEISLFGDEFGSWYLLDQKRVISTEGVEKDSDSEQNRFSYNAPVLIGLVILVLIYLRYRATKKS